MYAKIGRYAARRNARVQCGGVACCYPEALPTMFREQAQGLLGRQGRKMALKLATVELMVMVGTVVP